MGATFAEKLLAQVLEGDGQFTREEIKDDGDVDDWAYFVEGGTLLEIERVVFAECQRPADEKGNGND